MYTALVGALPFAFLGMGLTGLGNMMKSCGYRYLKGDYQEEFSSKPKIFHLKACMFPGTLPRSFGGVTPANDRFDRLVATLRKTTQTLFFFVSLIGG